MEETNETQTINPNEWLKQEADKLTEHKEYDELPSLKLVPNEITEVEIDFSKPFDEWTGESGSKTVTKKIIPVSINGNKMNWWLNIKNPVYGEIVKQGLEGKAKFKVLQTGTQADTKYVLVN